MKRAYETWGVAMEVPEIDTREVVLLNQQDLTCMPGADMSGFSTLSSVGPLLLKKVSSSSSFVAPTAITLVRSPGLLAVEHSGPALPIAQTGIIPAARNAKAQRSNVLSP